MKKIIPFLLAIMALCAMFSAQSCISDAISTSPSDTLSFSRDTVNFDTVFTGLGTPTARLIVSNRAKKGIEISSIRLRRPDTNFQINVDGVSAREFSNVEIRGRDSIFVFIECYIPESQGNTPALVEDELEFVTNGVTQTVRLEAYGQNVTRLRGLTVTADMTIGNERPYVVFDSLVVERGARLSIAPGAQVLFHDGAELRVRGTLEAVGETGRLIQMRGDRLDNVLPNVGYDILAGQWRGITFEPGSFDNRLEYVDMRSTEHGVAVDSCGDLSRTKLTIRNSWLHNSQGNVLSSRYAKVDAYGVCFSEAGAAVVDLEGGKHEMVQCTFANNYLFSAITGPILTLRHVLPEHLDDNGSPLMSASFENSIIYGIPADINEGDLLGSDVYLRNVSLKAQGSNDEHFIDCLWDCDPQFLTDRPRYYFNYRVRPDSPVIGMGNPAYVNDLTLYDIDGDNRLAEGNPTLGAYALPGKADGE